MKERNKSMNEGLISVIIPVYNAQNYLKRCLDSVFQQNYQDIEVICVNDGSSDKSLSILNDYQERYPQKMVIKSITNGGQANARNVGIEMANGEFLCFVDSDDYLNDKMVEKLYNKMLEQDSDLVICDMDRIFEGKVSYLERVFRYDINIDFDSVTTIYEHPEIICYLMNAPFAKLIRRSFLNKHNIRFIKGYIYEDLVFVHEILAVNPRISMINEKLYYYIVRNDSTMTSKKSKVTDMFISYQNVYQAYERNGREKEFKTELDYLCLYHVMIGTSFRMFRSKQYGLIASIRQCRKYVRDHKCNTTNKYIHKKGIISRLFIKVFA